MPYSSTLPDMVFSRATAKLVLFWVQSTLVWLGWVSSKWAESAAPKIYYAHRNLLLGYPDKEASLSTCIFPFKKAGKTWTMPDLLYCISINNSSVASLSKASCVPTKRALGSSFSLAATCSRKNPTQLNFVLY